MKNTTITRTQSLVEKFDAIVNENNINEFDVNIPVSEDIQGGTKGVIRIGHLYVICWEKAAQVEAAQ